MSYVNCIISIEGSGGSSQIGAAIGTNAEGHTKISKAARAETDYVAGTEIALQEFEHDRPTRQT
jgi:hypothetical protein